MRGYELIDEPTPSAWTHLAVRPLWPLFAVMFAGSWLAWPWAVFNGFVVGCPNRWWEAGLAVLGFAGNTLGFVAVVALHGSGVVSDAALPYWFIGLTVWRLGVSYLLHIWQEQTFDLYEYTGGRVANGMPIVFLGFLARPLVLGLGLVGMVLL